MSVLEARDLSIQYQGWSGTVQALDGASLALEAGEVLAVVGESGSGKSTLGMAVLGLLPGNASRSGGDLRVDGRDIFSMLPSDLRQLRRSRLGFIFQDAAGSLDPTRRIDHQLEDSLGRVDRAAVLKALDRVLLPDVERVARSYPHQLSGGMAQRVAIAIALSRAPSLIVADEPTAALDTEVKHEILQLLSDVCRLANASLLILTHDVVGISRYCSRLAVMYGGRVVEVGDPQTILTRPRHPYTRGLLEAVPGYERPGGTLRSIVGAPPVLTGRSAGCAFAPRCEFRIERCVVERPEPADNPDQVLCHRVHEVERLPFVPVRAEVLA